MKRIRVEITDGFGRQIELVEFPPRLADNREWCSFTIPIWGRPVGLFPALIVKITDLDVDEVTPPRELEVFDL